MGHKRKNGPKYPGSEHPGAQKPRLISNIFKIENIFYKAETEGDKYGKKYSFFHGIYKGERAREDTEMLARFFDNGYDHIIKKHKFESSKGYSSKSNSPIFEG